MTNPELILERLDALNDDELIALIKKALEKSGIPYEEKTHQKEKTRFLSSDVRDGVEPSSCGVVMRFSSNGNNRHLRPHRSSGELHSQSYYSIRICTVGSCKECFLEWLKAEAVRTN